MVEKTPSGRKERTTYSPYKETAEMVQKKNSEKATSPNKEKRKKETERNRCGYRDACISKDDCTKGRGFNESIETKTNQNKTNVTAEKSATASANETFGGYKFTPLVASLQGRPNQHKPACFGLSSPWSFPSRSGIPLHAVVQPWFSLQRDPFRHEMFRPLFCSEIVQETPHLLFSPRHSPRPPPCPQTSRTSGVSYPPCAPQIPQTKSASCVKSPRCSHFPS